MVVFLGVLWALWGAWWLRRVELRREFSATVAALGLVWQREGLGPSLCASGRIGVHDVEVRWRRGMLRERVRARVDGAWIALADAAELDRLRVT